LTKLGAGELVISNVAYQSVTGADVRGSFTWQANAGTLSYQQVDSGADFAGFNVNAGATLAGNGKINGAVAVNSGGTLSPGNSAGSLGVGSLTLATNSVFAVELNGLTLGTQYDNVDVTGGVVLQDGQLVVTLGFTPAVNDSFVIISNDLSDAVSGQFLGLSQGSLLTVNSTIFQVSYVGGTGNDVVLTVIPEPSALTLVGAGLLLLLVVRRRR
jgi:hypothetical protein